MHGQYSNMSINCGTNAQMETNTVVTWALLLVIRAIWFSFLNRNQLYGRCYMAQAHPVRAWVILNAPGSTFVP